MFALVLLFFLDKGYFDKFSLAGLLEEEALYLPLLYIHDLFFSKSTNCFLELMQGSNPSQLSERKLIFQKVLKLGMVSSTAVCVCVCVGAHLGCLCLVLVPQSETKDTDKLGRAQSAFQVIVWSMRRGLGELCSFILQRSLKEVTGCLVSIFCYLLGGFEASGTGLLPDMHNKKIRDNRQIARRTIPIKCKKFHSKNDETAFWGARKQGILNGFLKTHSLE